MLRLRRAAPGPRWHDGSHELRRAQNDVVKAINGDPFIGMFETPVTSSPLVRAAARDGPAPCGRE